MKYPRILLILAVLVFLPACNIPSADPTGTPLPPTATAIPIPPTPTNIPILPPVITSVTIQAPASAGDPVLVLVSGEVMDACTQVELTNTQVTGQTYQFTLESKREPGMICAQAITPFNWDTAIETTPLAAGIYTVLVNGSGGTFEIKPTPAPNSASISGYVWYDKCETTGGEGGTPLTAGPNCLQVSQYSFVGNGVVDPGETYTPAAYVELGQGACPAKGYAVAVTDINGRYGFTGLPGGSYCVSVDPLYPENISIMIPGGVHPPGGNGKGYYDLTLDEGEARTDANFGWDWQ
jgi:hypothetical protein